MSLLSIVSHVVVAMCTVIIIICLVNSHYDCNTVPCLLHTLSHPNVNCISLVAKYELATFMYIISKRYTHIKFNYDQLQRQQCKIQLRRPQRDARFLIYNLLDWYYQSYQLHIVWIYQLTKQQNTKGRTTKKTKPVEILKS